MALSGSPKPAQRKDLCKRRQWRQAADAADEARRAARRARGIERRYTD